MQHAEIISSDSIRTPPPASGCNFLYNNGMNEAYELGDRVVLKKKHPCGSDQWTIVRLGAEIGLECEKCHHRVLLTRRELSHKMKGVPVKRTTDSEASSSETNE